MSRVLKVKLTAPSISLKVLFRGKQETFMPFIVDDIIQNKVKVDQQIIRLFSHTKQDYSFVVYTSEIYV